MLACQQFRDHLIAVFPELQPTDFPPINHAQDIDTWITDWLSEYPISREYLLECDYEDWSNSLDLKLHFLKANENNPIPIDSVLDDVYDFFEPALDFDELSNLEMDHFEIDDLAVENLEVNDLEVENFEQDDVNEDDSILVEAENILLDNILNCILRNGIDVIFIDLPVKFQLILSRNPDRSALQALAAYLTEHSDPNYPVRYYCARSYSHHLFPYLIGKL